MSSVSAEDGKQLAPPWNERTAAASMQRWQTVCGREGWGRVPRNQALLQAVFGASWYLTRFLFYRGRDSALLLDREIDWDGQMLTAHLRAAVRHWQAPDDPDLDALRVAHNELLLQLLAADLQGRLEQEALESLLSQLAVACLQCLLDGYRGQNTELDRLVVLGMGRMAVGEMNYGSDLDLVFLYTGDDDVLPAALPGTLAGLQRCSAAVRPCGRLYEIDVRLRPHGTAGTLVSSLGFFRRYHLQQRETWERQSMTRCRLLQDSGGQAASMLQELRTAVFQRRAASALRREVAALRGRVQHQLGSPRGYCELKRGPGGIMDVDFIAHVLQLEHGMDCPRLQTLGTRAVLREAASQTLIDAPQAQRLLQCYDFLKRLEGRLRLFEYKAVSRFPRQAELLSALARGCNLPDGERLLQEYEAVTRQVRTDFTQLVAPVP